MTPRAKEDEDEVEEYLIDGEDLKALSQKMIMEIEYEKRRLEKLKKQCDMKLFDYIKAIKKRVSFYCLFNALDELDECKDTIKNQDQQIKFLEMLLF